MQPSNTRDETQNHPKPNDERVRVTDELNDSTRAQNSLDQAGNSHRPAHLTSTIGQEMTTPSSHEEPFPATPPLLPNSHNPPVVAPICMHIF